MSQNCLGPLRYINKQGKKILPSLSLTLVWDREIINNDYIKYINYAIHYKVKSAMEKK